MPIIEPTITEILAEFVSDIEAAHGEGANDLRREWPDLHVTYERAVEALKQPVAPTTIWTAAIEHRNGTNSYAARTEAALWETLSVYCREYWLKDGPGGDPDCPPELKAPENLTDQEIVHAYFDYIAQGDGEETCTMAEILLHEEGEPS